MRKFYLLFCLLTAVSYSLFSQSIISTFAGLGEPGGYSGDGGPATLARMNSPEGLARDASGNVYVADASNHCIRKINTAGIITTIAGNGTPGLFGDGALATTAKFNRPRGCTIDAAGNIYIADENNCRVRMINTSGIISTFAGTTCGYGGDGGPATAAKLNNVLSVTIGPGGDIYIADGNSTIRKVNASGIISTVAGTPGVMGFGGDGGPATLAQFRNCYAAQFDVAGNMYISDIGNHRIRKVNTSGIITTYAGIGVGGVGAFSGDGGPATAAELRTPVGLAVDGNGNVYICDEGNHRIRKINTSGIINTIAGNGIGTFTVDGVDPILAGLTPWYILLIDSAHYYIGDAGSARVRLVAPPPCTGTPAAGTVNATITSGCGTYTSDLSLSGTTVASSLTYQWQSSPDNSTWTSVSGATTSTYTASVTAPIYYRSIVRCTPSSASDTTLSIFLDDPVPALSPISGSPSICVGATSTYTDTAMGGTWSSTNTTVATIGSSTGILTGISGGTATIIYSKSNACGTSTISTTVTIVPPPTPAAISGASTVCVGAIITLSDSDPGGIWSSGNSAVAAVNASGIVTGVNAGTTNVTYTLTGTCGTGIATRAITVNPLPNAGTITGASSVCVNSATSLTDAVSGGAWSSGTPSIITVDVMGVATGMTAGTAMVSYSFTNVCGTAYATRVMTVDPLPVVGPITGSLNVCPGTNTTLSDATPSGVWSSANPAIATVSSSGLVTGVTAGNVVISYGVSNAFGCLSAATVTVTVNAIPSGVIVPGGSVTICTAGYAALSAATGVGYTYQWQLSGSPIAGATNSTYIAYGAGSYNATVTNGAGCSTATAATTVVVSAAFTVVPTVTIAASPSIVVCAGNSVGFTATAANGGTTPLYQWYVNSTAVGTGAATFSYTPANGDTVKCILTSSYPCAIPNTALATLVMTVNPIVTPIVSVSAAPNDTVCLGDGVNYLPTLTYGGTAPTYLWVKNGANVATGPTYFDPSPVDGDVVVCKITSNHVCVTTSTVSSAPLITHVLPHSTNTLTVTASSTNISSGSSVTFSAVSPYATSFQWYINGTPVTGATNAVFVTNLLVNGNMVNCAAYSDKLCVLPATIISGGIRMQVSAGVNDIFSTSFQVFPNPNKGNINVSGDAQSTVAIEIGDVLGHIIYNGSATPIDGKVNHHIELNRDLSNGHYFIRVTSENESTVFQVVLDR